MSQLPSGWRTVHLSEVCEVNPRDPGPTDHSVNVSFIPMPAVSDIDGVIKDHGTKAFTEVAKGYTRFREHDVIFAKITPCMENGKIAIATTLHGGLGCGSTEFHVLRSTGAILPRYLWRFLRQESFRHEAERHMTGAVGQRRVPTQYIRDAVIPLPPLEEQRRIVAQLDSLFDRSRSAREELGRIPRLVERYKQAILAAAFRGDLTPDWRDRQNALSAEEIRRHLLDERDARRREKGVRMKGANRNTPPAITGLPTLPRGWAWSTFEECSWDLTVGHVGPMKSRYVSRGIPFLRSFNVRPNRIDTEEIAYIDETFDKELQKSKLAAGTIVVVRTGAPGVAAVIPKHLDGANCSDLVICRAINSIDPHYAAHYVNSSFAQNLVRQHQVGVAQQHFNVGAMSSLAIPVAPLDEQLEIVRRIRYAFQRVDKLQYEAVRARNLLDRLDQATLAKAFRGELRATAPVLE